ncbi:flagellar basal-body rod protein FlgG [Rhizorhabdus sp.]|jgi:flagellar basal-body rod protein FlgG|uniref:flagellar basal-body rod protein FlgG n=1 Tax=Rhizorhabdus sp. TaxID=1968843 RepID=UPI001B6E756A|nr:flagellar basal-body rod protein FlgG [Rhizorhabdus sp.]MBP8232203.1 flagellar basal-body rod protein FlgG [Rhizorhabdus sp.]
MTNAALHVARTGLDAQNMRMQVIANNLANVNTTGFKRDRASFETLAYQAMTAPGAASSESTRFATGTNLGSGVQINGTSKVDTQGSLQTTDNALDLAVEGSGFFQIQLPDGRVGYTRDGSFHLSSDGTMVNSDGYQLLPQIQIPDGAANITIAANGAVSVTLQGQTEASQVGTIEIARFTNPAGLQAEGNNVLTETSASGQPQVGPGAIDGRGSVRQGALESSNVNIVQELVDMIETQRAYEVNSKMIQSTDQMLQYVNQNV